MENTEKKLSPKVQEFIENAKKAQTEAEEMEMQKQQVERDEYLISLGLYTEEKVEGIMDSFGNKYYDTVKTAISVTDEEFDEIKKYAPKEKVSPIQATCELNNGAEQLLNVLNTIGLIIACIVAIILITNGISSYNQDYLIVVGVVFAMISVISFSCMKVVLNISNNLHKINSKLK